MKRRRMLLYMSDFYGYYKEIISELNAQNWDVTWYLDQLRLTAAQLVIAKIDKGYKERLFDAYFQKSLEENRNESIDMILVIFAAGFFRPKHMALFKQYFPNTEVVYYTWDSITNYPVTRDLVNSADRAYTFDLADSETYGINFLPLFYIPGVLKQSKMVYHCSSIMSFQPEKSEELKKLLKTIPPDTNNYIFLRVGSKLLLLRMKLFSRKQIGGLEQYFHLESLSRNDVISTFAASAAVIDCPRPHQNGLTMRTFEVLSLGRKLITTNENIKKYDFYSPDNICVIDEKNECIPKDFFDKPFDDKYALSDKYSLPSFIQLLTTGVQTGERG